MSERSIRVLLVEDHLAHVLVVRKHLESSPRASFAVEVANRLSEGLARLATGGIDVVLLDLSLPDSPPAETFGRLHEHAPRVPVVILTGADDDEMALEALRAGAQDYLNKGWAESELLVRTILYSIERQRAQKALRESEERYALAVEGAHDGLWDWQLDDDRIYFSGRWKAMLGYQPGEIGDNPDEWFRRVHVEDVERLQRAIQAHLEARSQHFEHEHRMLHRGGSYRWMLSRGAAVRNAAGQPYRMAGSLSDIQNRKLAEERLLHDAMHDALTDLPNWALFMDRLAVSIGQAKRRHDYLFAVLLLDLDRFKNVNDSLGHAAGDQLLVAIARRLEKTLRPGDTLARLGGDEFAILANDIGDPSNTKRLAQRILEDLRRPFTIDRHEVFTGASVGIALSSTGYNRAEDVLRDADTAMYRAKSSGRNQHAIFDRGMHRQAVELLRLETEMRRGVERGEFRTHYQPIVALSSGEISGFEALARWHHPERGMVYPDEFIPMAEETGLIIPIGWTVLREACNQMAMWQQRYELLPLTISVNLSARQFLQPDLVDQVAKVLGTTGLDSNRLHLEITESVIMDHAESAVDKLRQLSQLDLRLHIDDFGTGYSSLSYLHRLPTHAIKIDRSFVSRTNHGDTKGKIVDTIVALARGLGMQVAAEGLETREQLSHLRGLDCEFGQGFLFSRALTSEAAGALIESRPRW